MCHPIGFVFFWMHQKNKNTTLVSSYWICFLGSPIGFAFLEAPKKQKHNPCALLLDLFFLKAPKKQKHNPCALLLDLLFWQPPKSKNTTLMPSYWICFFGSPKKAKTKPLCPLIAFAFFGSPKKAKKTGALVLDVLFRKPQKKKTHNPYAKHKHNPCALVLDLLFWQPRKTKTASTTRSTWRNVSLTWIITTN